MTHTGFSKGFFGRFRWVSLLPFLAVFMIACFGEEFDPEGKLNDKEPQVLGIRTEPPEIGGGDTVTVDSLIHWPQGTPHTLWFLCIPTQLEQITRCVAAQIGETRPPLCAENPFSTLCTAGTEASFSWTLPDLPQLDEIDEIIIFIQQVLSGSEDVWAACGDAIRNNIPTANCLISLKNLTISNREVKNINPRISHFTFHEEDMPVGEPIVATAGEKAPLMAVVDTASLDELRDDSDATNFIFMDLRYFTTCGELESYGDRIYCVMALDGTRQINCEPAPNRILPKKDWTGDCVVHAVLRDNLGGIDFFTQDFSFR